MSSAVNHCNYKLFKSNADSLITKIIGDAGISQSKIEQNLNFINNEKDVYNDYADNKSFELYCDELSKRSPTYKLTLFVETCKKIYNDPKGKCNQKIMVYMILKEVSTEYVKYTNRRIKLKALMKEAEDKAAFERAHMSEVEKEKEDERHAKLFDRFRNADKSIDLTGINPKEDNAKLFDIFCNANTSIDITGINQK